MELPLAVRRLVRPVLCLKGGDLLLGGLTLVRPSMAFQEVSRLTT